MTIADIPVVFSPFCEATPRFIDGVVYARDMAALEEWLDSGWLRELGIDPGVNGPGRAPNYTTLDEGVEIAPDP